jgi:hypothetical protein
MLNRISFLGRLAELVAGSVVYLIFLSASMASVNGQAVSPVTKINEAAAAAAITVEHLRGNISVLSGSGGNITVLAGPEGKFMVDAGIAVSQK